jgi:hypothetical protein
MEPPPACTVRRDTRMLTMTEAIRSPHHKAASCGITPSEITVAQAMIGTAVAAIRMVSRDCRRAIAHLLGSMPLRVLLESANEGEDPGEFFVVDSCEGKDRRL